MIVAVSRRGDFDRLRQLGVRRSGPTLALTAVTASEWAAADHHHHDEPHRGAPHADGDVHVAFAIPSALGSAVHRNRARRRLKAALGQLLVEGRLEAGWYLIACRRLSPPLPFEELLDELARLTASATAEPTGSASRQPSVG